MGDCPMNLTVTRVARPQTLKITPASKQQTPPTTPPTPQNGAGNTKQVRRTSPWATSLQGASELLVCVQTRGQLACGLLLVLDSVPHFLTSGGGRGGLRV